MKNKKLFAILTLVCFMMTLMPVAAFAADTANSNSVAYVTEETNSVDVSYNYKEVVKDEDGNDVIGQDGKPVTVDKTFRDHALVTLSISDYYGDPATTTLYVWVTKEGSKAPVNTVVVSTTKVVEDVTVADKEVAPIGTEVFKIPNMKTKKEALAVDFFATGKYEIHASATAPSIENGVITNAQEFTYTANKVEVTSNPAKIENYRATVTLPAKYVVEKADGTKTPEANNQTVADGDVVSALAVKANNVAEEKVEFKLYNIASGKALAGRTMTITPVGAIDVDKETVTTDVLGMASFKVSGRTEGTYKVYVTYGQFEFTVEVVVGATQANTIKCVDQPTNPVDILNTSGAIDEIDFEMYDVNGNKIDPTKIKAGWENAAKSTETKLAGYVAIVEQPAGSKLENKDLYFDGKNVVTKKNITVEGTYTFKVVLDNGNYATGTMEVKAFTTPVELVVKYPATVELGSTVKMSDLYWLDANKVQKDAKGINLAATGYAVANFDSAAKDAPLTVKSDEKYIGQEITITAVDERYNLIATATVKVANDAKELKFATNKADVDVNNEITVNVVDADGANVSLGGDAKAQNANYAISYVVLDKPEGARVFCSTVAGSEKLAKNGSFKMNLTSNKVGNVAVQAVVKYSYTDKEKQADVVKYYTGTQIFAVGTAGVGDVVVMSIGSNEIVINDTTGVIDAAPMIQNNRTFVPFRALAEAFGAEVAYDEATQAVTASLNGVEVVMTIGSATYTVNGVEKTADVAPFIASDRTYVPVRFAAEAFGIKVIPTYNPDGTTADILFNL